MKKLLVLLLSLISLVAMLAACGESGTKCTHRDADDNGKCDECSAAFEDGKEPAPCSHVDADDNEKCDKCGEDFEDGKEPLPGTIYGEKVFPAVIYKKDDAQVIVDGAYGTQSYMQKNSSVTPALFADTNIKFPNEIVIGDTSRDVSAVAKEKLTDAVARKSEELGKSVIGYLVYSNGSSVALVWTDFQLAPEAIAYFQENYLNDSELVLEEGYTEERFIEGTLLDYLSAREDKIMEESWKELAAAIPEEYSEDIMAELELLYSLYDFDAAIVWLAGLYDAETGGWYGTYSAKNTVGFGPDIESTVYGLRNIGSYTGEMFGGDWTKAIPNDILMKSANWVYSLQDENGYFYHPQWPKEMIEETGFDLRITRDLGSARTILEGAGLTPKYGYLATASDKNLKSGLGTSTAAAVSKVVAVSMGIAEAVESDENFAAYIEQCRSEYEKATDSQKAGYAYTWGSYCQSTVEAIKASAERTRMTIEFFDSIQNPENGCWSEQLYYNSANGIHKISSVYTSLGTELKYADKIIASNLEILSWVHKGDRNGHLPGNSCEIYNIWSNFGYVYENIRACSPGTIEERNAKCDAIKELVFAGAADAIHETYLEVIQYKKDGGSFSTYKQYSQSNSGGLAVCVPNTIEGEMAGFLFAAYDIPHYIYAALDLLEYEPPYFTEEDRVVYVETIRNAKPVEKLEEGELRLEDPVLYDFEEVELGNLPAGLTVEVKSASISTGTSQPNEGAYIKTVLDGDRKVLGIKSVKRPEGGKGRNYSVTLNANPTSKLPTASRLEFSIKISTDTPALAKLLYFTQKPDKNGSSIIQPYIGTDAEGNVTFYDSKGKNPAVIGKTGEYIDLVLEYDWVGGSYSLYKGDTLLGSSTANYGFTKHQLVSTLVIYTDATTEASIYLDNIRYTVYEKEAEK